MSWVSCFSTVLSKNNNNNLLRYRIYSINRHGRLLNFWTLRVGAYSRWALIQGRSLKNFQRFQQVCTSMQCSELTCDRGKRNSKELGTTHVPVNREQIKVTNKISLFQAVQMFFFLTLFWAIPTIWTPGTG